MSLSLLAFLPAKDSDYKLETAQRSGCSLAGQPQEVIETVRDIIEKIRRNLSPEDRNKNMQSRRDNRKMKEVFHLMNETKKLLYQANYLR